MLTGVWCAFFPSRYRIHAMASALQMEKEAVRHFQKLCFMRTVFQSVRSLRGMGEDVKVCSPHLACSPSSEHTLTQDASSWQSSHVYLLCLSLNCPSMAI